MRTTAEARLRLIEHALSVVFALFLAAGPLLAQAQHAPLGVSAVASSEAVSAHRHHDAHGYDRVAEIADHAVASSGCPDLECADKAKCCAGGVLARGPDMRPAGIALGVCVGVAAVRLPSACPLLPERPPRRV